MGTNLYFKAEELLSRGKKIIFAKIIRRSGSTPRDVGSMCIISENGDLYGTVGGGALEYKAQKRAIELLKSGKSFIYKFKLSNEDLAKNGMICGGNVDLYMIPLFPSNKETILIFNEIKKILTNNHSCTLITHIQDTLGADKPGQHAIIKENGQILGQISDVDIASSDLNKNATHNLITLNGKDLFIEKITTNPRIFLFGAGHVSKYVAKLAKMVGFDISLIDDRPEFANNESFPDVDNIHILNFQKAFDELHISENSYILIITRGHLHDKDVLEQALATKAGYIGMIGSIKKRNIIYRSLIEKGFSKETLEKVHSPIGLEIRAETPEEIAVSIVGELIKTRAPESKKITLIQ